MYVYIHICYMHLSIPMYVIHIHIYSVCIFRYQCIFIYIYAVCIFDNIYMHICCMHLAIPPPDALESPFSTENSLSIPLLAPGPVV